MPSRAMEDLRRLEKRYPRIVLGLRRLIPYPGLWADIPFNFLKRLVECASPTVRTSTTGKVTRCLTTVAGNKPLSGHHL